MANFSERLQSTSQRLLSLYGQSITLTRETEGSYNTATGEATTTGSTSYSGWGNPGTYSKLELLKTNILESDIKLFFYSATRPKVGDSLTWDDESYRIINVETLNAQGNDCLYILQLRIG
jgi:hypothetical protein